MDETARGLGGFCYRRLQTLRFGFDTLRFVIFFLTKGREVRRRYAAAERSGGTIWLDRGPFHREPRPLRTEPGTG